MKKSTIILSITSSIFCFAQQERDRKFQLLGGVEYRITPFNFNNTYDGAFISSSPINYNRDMQLSGLSINIGLEWFFLRRTSFGIIQSFRYDEIYYPARFDDPNLTISRPVSGIIYDTELQVKHYFPLKNGDKLFANVGYNMMNRNTSYTINYSTTYDEGYTVNTITTNWFNFNSYKIGIGYQYKNLQIGAGLYVVDNPSAFVDSGSSTMGIPYFKLNYIFGKF